MLGQYGLLYALEHPDQISRLLVLNTPLAVNAKLRPELAAYKAPLPFMRPGNVSGRGEGFEPEPWRRTCGAVECLSLRACVRARVSRGRQGFGARTGGQATRNADSLTGLRG